MSDFWEKIAANPSSHLLTEAMDSHLSGKSFDESFGSVRDLTDAGRSAKAIDLSTPAGAKVVFAGDLGAYLTYDDTPPKGATGEVVNVKSANGDITNHDGKVFVQWDDGKFRAIHAEHLRLAERSRTASDLKADFEKIKALVEQKPDNKFLKGLLKQMADKGFAPTDKQMAVVKKIEKEIGQMKQMQKELKSLGKKAAPRWIPPDPTFTKVVVWASKLKDGQSATAWDVSRELGVPPLGAGHALESLVAKGVLKKDRKYYSKRAKASQDENDIGDGGIIEAPPEEMEIIEGHFGQDPFSELTEMVESDGLGKAANIRVASLGDLSDFLKVAEGMLIHKSTQDLWSFAKDADGSFLVSRLFDDSGSPLQG